MINKVFENSATFFCIFLFTIAFTNIGEAQINQGMSLERLSRIDAVMKEYIDQEKLAGNVVYVSRNGMPVYYKSFGMRDVEAELPMNRNDMFRIASQTKAITSVGIMILQEQGKLLINDDVGKYLPEYLKTTVAEEDGNGGYNVVAANRKITLRDLLTHTAGIDYGLGPAKAEWEAAGIQGWYFADRDEPIRETVRRIAALPQNSQPGENFVYGYNTDILGAVIEIVSGQPLDQFLSENILNPLHMHDTYFYVPEDKVERIATVYSLKGDKITRAADPGQLENGSHIGQGQYTSGPRKSFAGGAGLVSTAQNYGRFLQMVLNGGELNGTRILGRKSIELMTQNHIGAISLLGQSGVGFGLGFQVVTDLGEFGQMGTLGEFGWGGAYHSTYWIDPKEKLVVVYLTQLIPANDIDDAAKLRSLIYQAIVD